MQKSLRLFCGVVSLALIPSCSSDDFSPNISEEFRNSSPIKLSETVQETRSNGIKTGTNRRGLTNAVLLAGIAKTETGFAHCHSEATWACQGPMSPDCNGGPVIAGAGDGACNLKQGGLGMFQFDSGTHTQTLNTYGEKILRVDGSSDQAVSFILTRLRQEFTRKNPKMRGLPNFSSDADAIEWLNRLAVDPSDEDFNMWIYFLAWRYNGCESCSRLREIEKKYRENTLTMLNAYGNVFWQSPAPDVTEPEPEPELESMPPDTPPVVTQNSDTCEDSFLTPFSCTYGGNCNIRDEAGPYGNLLDQIDGSSGEFVACEVKQIDGPFKTWVRIKAVSSDNSTTLGSGSADTVWVYANESFYAE